MDEKLIVRILNQTYKTVTDKNGNWQLWLHPMSHSSSVTMTVSGSNTLVVENILIGEVWFAAGQSNMKYSVLKSANSEEEISNSNYPEIRIFDAERSFSDTEKMDIVGEWVICSPETVGEITAAGYFFSRGIHDHLNVPVGLIDASWGATRCEAWTPAEEYKKDLRLNYWPNKWAKYERDFPRLKEEYLTKHKAWEQKAEMAKQVGDQIPREP